MGGGRTNLLFLCSCYFTHFPFCPYHQDYLSLSLQGTGFTLAGSAPINVVFISKLLEFLRNPVWDISLFGPYF